MMRDSEINFESLYQKFNSPIAEFDCGMRCGPLNEGGIPFCCDIKYVVPTVYDEEWEYLREVTDLWEVWKDNSEDAEELRKMLPDGQYLVKCKGHLSCQRNFRSVTCRSFPFFPYLTGDGSFIGLSYYWEYEDLCWVISNLHVVSMKYKKEFIIAFDEILAKIPGEAIEFMHQSLRMRQEFIRQKREIPILHRNGGYYYLHPESGNLREVQSGEFPKHGNYKIMADMPFADEIEA